MTRARLGPVLIGALVAGVVIVIFWLKTPDVEPQVTANSSAPNPESSSGTGQPVALTSAPLPDRASATTIVEDEAARMCAQILDDAADFAETEGGAAANPAQASELSDDELRAEYEDLLTSLAGSPDPERFLTAFSLQRPWARVSEDTSAQAQLVELGLRAADSGSPMLAWHALRACFAMMQFCPYPHLEQRLLEADRDNAETWAVVSELRYRRGDIAGALAAIRDAGRAPTSTWYYFETTAMIERTLASSVAESSPAVQRAMPYANIVGAAFGAPAGMGVPSLLPMCRVQSESSRAWAEACLALGTLRGEQGKTLIEQSFAYAMREQALTALGDFESAAEVAAEGALYRNERTAGGLELSMSRERVKGALMSANPEKFQTYLSTVQEFGEAEGGRIFLRQEFPALVERAGLLERDGARECVAQFFETPAAVGTRSATRNYPIQVGDELHISQRGSSFSTSLRVGSDGTITMPRYPTRPPVPAIAAVGKTTAQLEREIATMLSGNDRLSDIPPSDVFVILVSSRSPEELRIEFDDALREAAE